MPAMNAKNAMKVMKVMKVPKSMKKEVIKSVTTYKNYAMPHFLRIAENFSWLGER